MDNQENTVDLGQHRANFDEASGKLSIEDGQERVHLSEDEAYRLLVWLNDHYRDRLYEKMHDPMRNASEKQFDAGTGPAAGGF
jgi:hypothetical protein